MNKKQISKKSELSDGKITSHHSLHSLHPTYSYTNMSCLNHAYIVGTITNTKSNLFCAFSH